MNNDTQNRSNKKFRRTITRRLLIQYGLSLVGYVVGLILFILIMWRVCASISWRSNNLIYIILTVIREYLSFFAGAAIAVGWILITAYFISKPLRYLDEVVSATEKLVTPTDAPITLSESLAHVENEMNRVREKALSNARIAKDAEQRKNDLVIYLAHDLKTPLTSVIGYLTLLRDENQISDELREKYLSISLDKAEHLEDLINEFFEITRFNLSNITLEYSKVNLTRMLEQLTYEFKPMLMKKNLECALTIAPDTMIRCDVNKMQRVFDNLLRNAVNYSFPDSTISITAVQNINSLSISFVNSGHTIPKEKLERIFEQFFRLNTARSSSSGGAGLGLAIAKEIVELHGGTISASSGNERIEFTVVLPLS